MTIATASALMLDDHLRTQAEKIAWMRVNDYFGDHQPNGPCPHCLSVRIEEDLFRLSLIAPPHKAPLS